MKTGIFILLCLILVIPCKASIITVDDDRPADFNNIQAAINDSVDGDVIVVQPGIYTGDGNRDIDFGGRAVTVRSIDPNDPDIVAATVIDCNGTEMQYHRGFNFHSGEDNNSVVVGFTITNGYTRHGAGIYCSDSSPLIRDCNFTNCSADYWGGGIYCYKSFAEISHCTFINNSAHEGGAITTCSYWGYKCCPFIENCLITNNSASDCGGGINSDNLSSPTISNCTITSNFAGMYDGGGISIFESNPTITNCIISNNSTYGSGGGIFQWYEFENGSAITNCTITGNTAQNGGGGVCGTSGCDMTIINCTIHNNETIGGDLYFEPSGGGVCGRKCNMVITNCTINSNKAVGGYYYAPKGGGVHCDECSMLMTGCTISDNKVVGEFRGAGGGVCGEPDSEQITIKNCIISRNSADRGGGLYEFDGDIINCIISGNIANRVGGLCQCDGDITNCTIADNITESCGDVVFCGGSLKNCIIWGNSGFIFIPPDKITYSNVQEGYPGEGNIDADPLFFDPVEGDYHLLPSSPCIDAGDPNYIAEPNETDLNGNPRIVNGIVDIGAFEVPDPVEMLLGLTQKVIDLNLQHGIANSLDGKLDAALKALEDTNENNDVAAINSLQAFINAIEAQRGKKIGEADAEALIVEVLEIIDLLSVE